MDGFIGQALRPKDAWLFVNEALPNATAKESPVFQLGGLQSALEIVVDLPADISVTAAKKLTFELHTCDTVNGTFAKAATLKEIAGGASAATAQVKGELLRYAVPSNTKTYAKLKVVSDYDASAAKFSAATEYIAR